MSIPCPSNLTLLVTRDFENPSFLDHCPRQTMGFPQLFVCLPWVKPPFSPGIIPGPQVQQIVDMSGIRYGFEAGHLAKNTPQSTGSCQRILNHTINIHQEIIRIQNTLKQTHQNLSDIHQTSMEKSIKTPRFFCPGTTAPPGDDAAHGEMVAFNGSGFVKSTRTGSGWAEFPWHIPEGNGGLNRFRWVNHEKWRFHMI